MKTAFLGERTSSMHGSGLSGASLLPTPPPDNQFPASFRRGSDAHQPVNHQTMTLNKMGFEVDSWMEVWDYAGGASFRAFVADNGDEKSLFVFFDIEGVLGRDLKKAYVPFKNIPRTTLTPAG